MTPTIDPIALWCALSPVQQERLGALAIAVELVAQGMADDEGPDAAGRLFAFEAAFHEAQAELSDFLAAHCPPAYTATGAPRRPDLNPLGIRQCTSCGCTDEFSCTPPCAWAGPTTCTTCAPREAA